jgi:Cysteine-rich CPXCG
MYAAVFQCGGCFEWVETTVDESGGSRQQYVEDCQVCCQPNVLTVRWDPEAEGFSISAELES